MNVQLSRSRTREFFVVLVREGVEWEDSFQFNEAADAFDKADELQANGHEVRVVRRHLVEGRS